MAAGLFIGRFQPFHLGHLKDVKDAFNEIDELIIAVGSSQHSHMSENPFTVEERIRMIEDTLMANDISNYTIFPVPDIGDDKKWVEHVETLVPEFEVVFTGNLLTEKLFRERGYKVKKVDMVEEINATKIRDRMVNGEAWEDLVPTEVANFLKEIKGASRVKDIFARK